MPVKSSYLTGSSAHTLARSPRLWQPLLSEPPCSTGSVKAQGLQGLHTLQVLATSHVVLQTVNLTACYGT